MDRADQVLITATNRKDLPAEIEGQFFEVLRGSQGTRIQPASLPEQEGGNAASENARGDA